LHLSAVRTLSTNASGAAGPVSTDPSFSLLQIAENFLSLHSNKDFSAGSTLSEITSVPHPEKNRFTVQYDNERHIILDPVHLQYVNHSCDPNVFFDLPKGKLVALRDIKEGEELGFFCECCLLGALACSFCFVF
jgi:hypothetical protein